MGVNLWHKIDDGKIGFFRMDYVERWTQKGKIVQNGKRSELVQEEGIYAKLWKSQVCGFVV